MALTRITKIDLPTFYLIIPAHSVRREGPNVCRRTENDLVLHTRRYT